MNIVLVLLCCGVGVVFVWIVCWLNRLARLVWLFIVFDGEFDPGSGRTLAACLTHASRTGSMRYLYFGRSSGERVSNT